MKQGQPQTIYLKDYCAPAYRVDAVSLVFELGEESTQVTCVANYRRNAGVAADAPLELYGERLELLALRVNGRTLTADDYALSDTDLRIFGMSALATVVIVTRI